MVRYLLPALPIVCLAVALLILATQISIEQVSSPTPTHVQATFSPNSSQSTNPTVSAPTILPTQSVPISQENQNSLDRIGFLAFIKDVSLVVATGMIALTSAYVGAFIQSVLKEEEESRSEKRKRTQPYRDYLNYLLHVGQRVGLTKRHPGLKTILKNAGKESQEYEVSDKTIAYILDEMPLAWELSCLDDPQTQEIVDTAMDVCINFLMDIRAENKPNYGLVREKFLQAISALDKYDRK